MCRDVSFSGWPSFSWPTVALGQNHFPPKISISHSKPFLLVSLVRQTSFPSIQGNIDFPGQLKARRGRQKGHLNPGFQQINHPSLSKLLLPEGCLVPVVLRKSLRLKLEAISCVLLK